MKKRGRTADWLVILQTSFGNWCQITNSYCAYCHGGKHCKGLEDSAQLYLHPASATGTIKLSPREPTASAATIASTLNIFGIDRR